MSSAALLEQHRSALTGHCYRLLGSVVADTADAAAERAQKAGGTLLVGPMEVPGGDRIASLSDPQGAKFAVHSKR